MSSVFTAIVNYRTGRLVVDCLASLASGREAWHGGRVIVVDNDSGDDSVEIIRAAIAQHGWADWVELLPMPRNGGFAYGNNAAVARIREIAPDFGAVVLLNPDTVVMPAAIERLAEYLHHQDGVGIAGALIEDESGRPVVSAHANPSPMSELTGAARLGLLSRWLGHDAVSGPPARAAHACDWVSGACIAIRREVFDTVGPMDEGFFLYYEEVDFCLRAHQAGWSCWFLPEARVRHFEGASTGIKMPRRRRPGYWYASRRRFFVKAYGTAGLVAADLLWAIGRLSLVVRRALGLGGREGRDDEPQRYARDLLGGDFAALMNGELRRIAGETRRPVPPSP